MGSPPAAAAATDTQVIATDRVQNRMIVFDAATGTINTVEDDLKNKILVYSWKP